MEQEAGFRNPTSYSFPSFLHFFSSLQGNLKPNKRLDSKIQVGIHSLVFWLFPLLSQETRSRSYSIRNFILFPSWILVTHLVNVGSKNLLQRCPFLQLRLVIQTIAWGPCLTWKPDWTLGNPIWDPWITLRTHVKHDIGRLNLFASLPSRVVLGNLSFGWNLGPKMGSAVNYSSKTKKSSLAPNCSK